MVYPRPKFRLIVDPVFGPMQITGQLPCYRSLIDIPRAVKYSFRPTYPSERLFEVPPSSIIFLKGQTQPVIMGHSPGINCDDAPCIVSMTRSSVLDASPLLSMMLIGSRSGSSPLDSRHLGRTSGGFSAMRVRDFRKKIKWAKVKSKVKGLLWSGIATLYRR